MVEFKNKIGGVLIQFSLVLGVIILVFFYTQMPVKILIIAIIFALLFSYISAYQAVNGIKLTKDELIITNIFRFNCEEKFKLGIIEKIVIVNNFKSPYVIIYTKNHKRKKYLSGFRIDKLEEIKKALDEIGIFVQLKE